MSDCKRPWCYTDGCYGDCALSDGSDDDYGVPMPWWAWLYAALIVAAVWWGCM